MKQVKTKLYSLLLIKCSYFASQAKVIIMNYVLFRENDGDLENDVNPLKAPEGNYHIVEEEGVVVLNRDTFAHFVKPKVV